LKYRRLSLKELEKANKDFVEFLAINGIPAEDWQRLKSSPADVDRIIEAFSEAWYEMYLRKIQFLTIDLGNEVICFQCGEKSITLVGCRLNSGTIEQTLNQRLEHNLKNDLYPMYTQSKPYLKTREMEVFDLLESGAKVDGSELYKRLSLALANQNRKG